MLNKNEIKITKYEVLNMDAVELNELFESLSDNELFDLVKDYEYEDYLILVPKLSSDLSAKLLLLLDEDVAKKILGALNFRESVAIINELEEDKRNSYLNSNTQFSERIENLKNDFLLLHPKDVANKISEMDDDTKKRFFSLFTAEELSEFFAYLDEEDAAKYLGFLSDNKASDVLENMDVDDAVDIINELDDENKENYLELMDDEIKDEIEEISEYSDDEVGSIMNTNFIEIDTEMDVKDAMKLLVKMAPDVDVINTLFVCEEGKYVGTLDFRKLIVTKTPCKIKEITDYNSKYCEVYDNIEHAIQLIDDYDIYALPVLKEGMLEGIVTIDDGFEALQSERAEDYNQLAGLTGEREEKESIFLNIRRRMPWLAILIVLDLLVCLLITSFENIISHVTVLVFFQSVILGLSGNVGMQSLAVCVRSLSNGELSNKKLKFKHILSELRNGIALGLIIAILSFVACFLFLKISKSGIVEGVDESLKVASIVSLSIFASLSLSSTFGCFMPIVFNSLNIDPAAASGPFITTLNDIIAISIYFTLAILLFSL